MELHNFDQVLILEVNQVLSDEVRRVCTFVGAIPDAHKNFFQKIIQKITDNVTTYNNLYHYNYHQGT